MFEEIRTIIAENLNVDAEKITETTSFKADLGADSLDLFEMVMALEDQFDIEIPSEDLEQIQTVDEVIRYIESHQ
ncbi:MAG: acyl carrier protein [Eubacteriales bacterium]|nr:acyl carrier protein [Eubacteriales bacterium]